jgi:hypothetical protein
VRVCPREERINRLQKIFMFKKLSYLGNSFSFRPKLMPKLADELSKKNADVCIHTSAILENRWFSFGKPPENRILDWMNHFWSKMKREAIWSCRDIVPVREKTEISVFDDAKVDNGKMLAINRIGLCQIGVT